MEDQHLSISMTSVLGYVPKTLEMSWTQVQIQMAEQVKVTGSLNQGKLTGQRQTRVKTKNQYKNKYPMGQQ